MGKVPDDLPDIDIPVASGPSLTPLPAVEEELNNDTDLKVNKASPANISRDHIPPNLLPVLPSSTADSDPSQHDPVNAEGDIPALDHFPAPPVHFPLPHLQRGSTGPVDGCVPPSYGRQVISPVLPTHEPAGLTPTTPTEPAVATTIQSPSPAANVWADTSPYLPAPPHPDLNQTPLSTNLSTTPTDNTEFGIRQSHPLHPSGSSSSSTLPKGSPQSSGVVLAMRNRFAQNVSCDRWIRIRETEFHSPRPQSHQENLQLRFLVYRSVCQSSPIATNPAASTLHYARTGLRQGQPSNVPSMMQLASIHRYAFHSAPVPFIFLPVARV